MLVLSRNALSTKQNSRNCRGSKAEACRGRGQAGRCDKELDLNGAHSIG